MLGDMGTSRRIECYHRMLWTGLGVHLPRWAGRSITEVLGHQCGAGGFPLGVEDYRGSEGQVLKWGVEYYGCWQISRGREW